MRASYLKKSGAIIFVTLFFTVSLITGARGSGNESGEIKIFEGTTSTQTQDVSQCTFYVFQKNGMTKQTFQMSTDDATVLYQEFESLKTAMTQYPGGLKTQILQREFLDRLDEKGMIPIGVTKNGLFSLLQPSIRPLYPRWFHPLQYQHTASEWLCTFASAGSGSSLPIIILPRFIPFILTPIPRIILRWNANEEAMTSCGGLRSGTGFIAVGQQKGLAIGFWGIGFTFSLPPVMNTYGVIGYALHAKVDAEYIEFFPPNNPPIITGTDPSDGEEDVLLTTSELRFQIEDPDKDPMSYTVTTTPDIGSGSGGLKNDGIYSIPLTGLQYDKIYVWSLEVSDGKDTITKQGSFSTQEIPPFDPFTEGWQYRKQITIQHSKVSGDLTKFTVLINVVDPDLSQKAQPDGDDILFMETTGVARKMHHEIEYYNEGTGTLVAWVKVPSISSTIDSIFYLYYGNPGSTNQQSPKMTWNFDYLIVQHMNDNTTSLITDSTRYNNIGVKKAANEPIQHQSPIQSGQKFDGTDDYIQFEDPIIPLGTKTISGWVKKGAENWQCILSNALATGNVNAGTTWNFEDTGGGTLYLNIGNGPTPDHYHYISLWVPIPDYEWHYYTMVYDDSSHTLYGYRDGVVESTSSSTSGSEAMPNYNLRIGKSNDVTYPFPMTGELDEIRISSIVKSPQWISTEYNNMVDPSHFFTIGPEEP